MAWFKVDDRFHSHPKVQSLDMNAIGLWAKAGSYCAQYLTDGVITGRQIRALGGTFKQAEKLVLAGLWDADDASPSARRYTFVNWAEYQPTRNDVATKRQEARDRMSAARAKKRSTSNDSEMFARTSRERSQDVRSDALQRCSHYPDPTRPDPNHKGGKGRGFTYGGTAQGEHNPPPENLDELAARYAAATPENPGVCPRHPNGNPTGEPCNGCKQARQQRDNQQKQAAQARREAIKACPHCDENGFIELPPTNGSAHTMAVRCNHTPPKTPKNSPPSDKQHNDDHLPTNQPPNRPEAHTGPY